MYATFTIELANHTKRDGTKAIYLRVTISKKHHRFPLHLFVKPENFEVGKVTRSDIGAMAKNIRIEQAMAKASKIVEDYYLRGKILTMEDFIAEYSDEYYGSQSFYDFAEREIPLMAVTRSPETMKCYTTLINNMKKFRPRVNMGDINLNFFRLYERHFIEGGNGGQQTAHKNLKYLKCLMNRAHLTGLIKDTSYQQFKIKQFEGHREFLDPEELEILKDMYWKQALPAAYNSALQYFLFGCYTGLRYHDLKVLTFKNIIETRDETGTPRKAIRIKQHKTKYLVTIPLVAEAVRLLPERGFDDQPVFKVLVNQYLNRVLEKIMIEARISKTITMHCARHTFATVALVKGIRINFVSKFLGHKNLKVTAIYAKYIDPTLIQEMRKWDAV
ncbi:MAG: tyrosine-type recombinase/integrase [Bacteroidetes bacterium]|nr:tyrosine-type recombinase/integrase [Bacteroidota bacterium]